MRKLALITAFVFIVSTILPIAVLADGDAIDAFEEVSFTKINTTEIRKASLKTNGVVGDFNTFAYVVFDNIDFKDGAVAMSYTHAGPANGTLKVKTVDVGTAIDEDTVRSYNDNPDFTIEVPRTDSWTTFETTTEGGFPTNIKGNKKVVVWVYGSGQNVGDAKSIQFHSTYSNAAISVNESNVTASLELYTQIPTGAALVTIVHNNLGALSQEIGMQTEPNAENKISNFELPLSLTENESVNAFLIDDNMNLLCEPQNGYVSDTVSASETKDKLYAFYEDNTFTVTGSTQNDYVLVGMIRKGATTTLLTNYLNIFTVKTIDGRYKISFTDENITTGNYEVVNNLGERFDLSYIDARQQKKALTEINAPICLDGESSEDAFIRVIHQNAELFGIEDIVTEIDENTNKNDIYLRINNNGYQYSTVNEFTDRVCFSLAFQKILDGGKIEDVIQNNSDILGVSGSVAYESYYSNSNKDELGEILRSTLPSDNYSIDKQKFKTCFDQAVALDAINNAKDWKSVDKVFSDFSNEIYTEQYREKYESLTKGQKKYVCDKLKGEDYSTKYNSVSEFASVLSELLVNVPSDVEEPFESGISAFSRISAIKCNSLGGKSDIALRTDCVGGMSFGGWIVFDDVYFDSGAVAMELTYGVSGATGGFDIYIGEVGESTENILNSQPVFTTSSENTGSWSTFKTFGYFNDFPRNITEHKKLVVKGNKISGDLKYIQFFKEYVLGGAYASDGAVKAAFNWSTFKGGDLTLIGAGYFGDGRAFTVKTKKITNAHNREVNETISVDTADAYAALLVDENFRIVGDFSGVVDSLDTQDQTELTAECAGTTVNIYGGNAKETLALGMRKSDIDSDDYENYTHIALVNPTDGNYSYKFTDNNMETGRYIIINSLGEEALLNYLKPQDKADILSKINNLVQQEGETKAEALERVVTENKENMFLEELIDSINNSENKEWIYEKVYNNGHQFESFESFSDRLRLVYVLSEMNGAEPEKVKELVDINTKVLGIDATKGYKDYYKDADKLSVAKYLSELVKADRPSETVSIQKLFDEAIVLNGINSAQSWGTVDKFIREFEEIFSFNGYGEYEKLSLSDKKEVCLSVMTSRPFTRIAQVSVKPVKESGNTGNTGGSSISSGGTSGNYGVAKNPEPKPETPEVPQNIRIPLNDLDVCAWAKNEINAMFDRGYVSGYDDGSFKPNSIISRVEFVHILMNAMKFNSKAETGLDFTDVDKDSWYYNSIKSAYDNGIVNGRDDGSFGIDSPITREEMAVIVYRISQMKPQYNVRERDINIAFADGDKISGYAYAGVYSLAKAGILKGTGAELFEAESNATRAEATVVIYRYLAHIGLIKH